MDNIDEKEVIMSKKIEKNECVLMISEKSDILQQSQELNHFEEMEVSEDTKISTESVVILVNPTPHEMDVTDLSTFNTQTNQNSSSLNILNQYGSSSSSECDTSSDSSSSSSDSSSSESDCGEDELPLNVKSLAAKNSDENDCHFKKNENHFKVKGELDINELPPIEELKISVSEEECTQIGSITSIVDLLVVIESKPAMMPLDIDTVLFLEHGARTLGKIFDVFGQVSQPTYCVRFNSESQISDNNIVIGMPVYCAPKTNYTSIVILQNLMKTKGSDASWENDIESSEKHTEYSDDEAERTARRAKKSLSRENKNTENNQNKIKDSSNRRSHLNYNQKPNMNYQSSYNGFPTHPSYRTGNLTHNYSGPSNSFAGPSGTYINPFAMPNNFSSYPPPPPPPSQNQYYQN